MKSLIIIPAFNEQENIERVVNNLKENYPEYDYIVINDCSTDNTAEICKKNGYNVLNLPSNLGIGGGVQTGYKYALEKGYDIAVQMDGDGQHDPRYLDVLTQNLKNGQADVCIGSRFITKEGFQSSGMRRFGINFLSFLIKICCKADVKDVTSGYRAVNRKFIEIYSKNYADDYPEPEAIVSAKMQGAKIVEIPVIMKERTGGVSSISPLKSAYYMIKVSLAILFYRITFSGGVKK
ncbi:MAG: glycosyltransferase family 2 protein [Clostridia bacterium]|nr:glycosyltransferase family 2 protein [Clostridia bacterium]